nr:MAG TPA: hypothetical protein [Caudoviricetes sp.]
MCASICSFIAGRLAFARVVVALPPVFPRG